MKVKINGKIFKVHENEERRFKITKGIDMFDLLYFKDWFKKGMNGGIKLNIFKMFLGYQS